MFDADTGVMFLAAKVRPPPPPPSPRARRRRRTQGDTSIRYYEIVDEEPYRTRGRVGAPLHA